MSIFDTNFQYTTTSAVAVRFLIRVAKAEVSSELSMQKLRNIDSLSVYKISLSSKPARLQSMFFWKTVLKKIKTLCINFLNCWQVKE